MRWLRILSVLAIVLALNGVSNAALIDRGGGLIYCDTLNITWLANANGMSGTWGQAIDWANNFEYASQTEW
jgi:hypothetical protein